MLRELSNYLSPLDTIAGPHVDPVLAVLYALILAYIPHFVKLLFFVVSGNKPRPTAPRFMWDQPKIVNNWMSRLAQRLEGAHRNGLEMFTIFGIAVILARQSEVDAVVLSSLSTFFVLNRLAYNFVYAIAAINVMAPLRTVVFMSGMAVCVRLLLLALSY